MSAPEASPRSTLWPRILSAAVFIPILVLVTLYGGLPYVAFVLFLVGVNMREFYLMAEAKGIAAPRVFGILSGFFICLALSGGFHPWLAYPERWLGASCLCLMLGLFLLLSRGPKAFFVNVSALLAGILYIALPLGCFLLLRQMGGEEWRSRSFALLPYSLTWLCDTFAFAIGMTLGRRKLAPSISPNKTVEGALGGIAGAVVGGILSKLIFASYLTWGDALALGVLVGIFGQVGDLLESAMKRDVGIKDSSRFIPGHGGGLDRYDSFFFTVPLVYFYLRFFLK